MNKRQSVLFVIRDKMGDSLIAGNIALHFALTHPDWAISILMRDAYCPALTAETVLEVIPYRSSLHLLLLTLWWRITGRRFDVLGVMRGFGKRTIDIINRIPAQRVIVHDARLASVATDVVATPTYQIDNPHYEPALRVARVLDCAFQPPSNIHFATLASRWQSTTKKYIVVCPLSDEPRRNIPANSVDDLYEWLTGRHTGLEIRILVRNKKELGQLMHKPAVPIIFFHDIPNLISILLQSSEYYGTDTGLVHLAAAMGMPCTIFFGPTQPHVVIPSKQAGINAIRTPILGMRHCDIKSCTYATCIALAVNQYIEHDGGTPEPTIPDCPLKQAQP